MNPSCTHLTAVLCLCLLQFSPRPIVGEDPNLAGGFLFLDGEYVPLPYHFKNSDGTITIPGTELSLTEYLRAGSFTERFATGRNRRRLESALEQVGLPGNGAKAVVALFHDAPPIILNQATHVTELLTLLTDERDSGRVARNRPEYLPEDFPLSRWNRWVEEFRCSSEFSFRAQSYVTRIEHVEKDNEFTNAVSRYAEHSLYPLSVFGMLVVVMSFGHLLSSHPSFDAPTAPQTLSPVTERVICRTLILVFVLSALDLLWTILATRTGSMRELNPVGSRFIQNPLSLTLFKASATALAVGLLYTLRHHLLARKASWWVCLVCTLVAARWVTFNSMFIP